LFDEVSFKDFKDNYQVSDELAQEFIEYARLNEAQIDLSKYASELKRTLKANIAQQLFGPNEYEKVLNQSDPMILKILELESRNQTIE